MNASLAAVLLVARLDALDLLPNYSAESAPWYQLPVADVLLGEDDATRTDRAWAVGRLGAYLPPFADGNWPGDDFDWDGMFARLRTAIAARRDPKSPPAKAGVDHPCGVV